jgi:hypothetical protein
VPVARDNLGRDRLDRQPHLLGYIFLDAWVDVGEGADGARDGAGRDLALRLDEADLAALELGECLGQLEPEGGRLGVDAVRAADGRRVFVLQCPASKGGEKFVDVAQENVRGAHQLHVEARVEHVR